MQIMYPVPWANKTLVDKYKQGKNILNSLDVSYTIVSPFLLSE